LKSGSVSKIYVGTPTGGEKTYSGSWGGGFPREDVKKVRDLPKRP